MLRAFLRWVGHLWWIRFGLRNRLVRCVHDPQSRRADYEFSVPFYRYMYSGKLDNLIDFEVYFFGAYAKPELVLFEDILRDVDDAVVWDVGANVGHHSLFMSSLAKQVMAFEPYTPVADIFDQRMRENGIDHVCLNRIGLSDKKQSLSFRVPPADNKGIGYFVKDSDEESSKENEPTPLYFDLVRADDFAAQSGLRRLDLVKIDVEGHERQVLQGMTETMSKFRPAIFMEWSNATDIDFLFSELISIIPNRYRVLQFIDRIPFAFFFNRRKHKLVEVTSRPAEGNLLLLPFEWPSL